MTVFFFFQLCWDLFLHLRSANHNQQMTFSMIFGYFSIKKKTTTKNISVIVFLEDSSHEMSPYFH